MGYNVKPENYRTCICGKVCKGGSAIATHGRKCPVERVRSAFFVWCACNDQPIVSERFVRTNLVEIARALVERNELDAGVLAEVENLT